VLRDYFRAFEAGTRSQRLSDASANLPSRNEQPERPRAAELDALSGILYAENRRACTQANRYQYASVVLMATLYLRNVPSDLDAALTADARANGVSKNRRAIEALQRGLGLDQIERSELVAQIRASRPAVTADVAKLIREERPGQDN
jgi:hypothetical protein